MLQVALNGKGAMPAKGGNPSLDDLEVARALVYMANHSGGSLPEPAEPAAGGDAPAPAPAAQTAPPAAPAAPAPAAPSAAAEPAAAAPAAEATNTVGEKLYKQTCFACHGTGVAGAPKFGDKASWAPYIETGLDTMVATAIKGKGAMPPKGGAVSARADDIRAAVQYMVGAAN